MENLVNDLLDLAKLENNSFNLSQDYFNLGKTIYQAFQILISSANQNEIQLAAQIDSESNMCMINAVFGDQRRFLQILLNFLSNSLKFTNQNGKITVHIKILDSQLCSDKDLLQDMRKSQEKIIAKLSDGEGSEQIMKEI
jgi:signal transduction histidine kinase